MKPLELPMDKTHKFNCEVCGGKFKTNVVNALRCPEGDCREIALKGKAGERAKEKAKEPAQIQKRKDAAITKKKDKISTKALNDKWLKMAL